MIYVDFCTRIDLSTNPNQLYIHLLDKDHDISTLFEKHYKSVSAFTGALRDAADAIDAGCSKL